MLTRGHRDCGRGENKRAGLLTGPDLCGSVAVTQSVVRVAVDLDPVAGTLECLARFLLVDHLR